MRNVPLLNPSVSNLPFMKELEESICKILRSGQYILGTTVSSFEEAFAEYFQVRHTIGISSGTDALIASLIALGVGPGDEVICPSFTFFATAGAVCRVGAKPVFIDVLPECFTMAPEGLRKAVTEKTKAIIPVHLFGQSAEIEAIMAIARECNLFVIEDACQAIGAELAEQKVGTFGDVGCFSFFPSKNLGGFGDAGLIITNSDELAEKLRFARNHGMTAPYEHQFVGGNFRIDAFQAALLSVKLRYLPEMEKNRRRNAKLYASNLDPVKYSLPAHVRGRHVYNQFTILSPDRNQLKIKLAEAGIASAIYYPKPLHEQPCFSNIIPQNLSLPVTEQVCKGCLSIPVTSEITEEQILYVIDVINGL